MIANKYLFFIVLTLGTSFAFANREQASGLSTRYPAGSIQSVEMADHALADVERERAAIEARFANEERGCYKLFFANSCREHAREQRRAALTALHPIEVEANIFKRRERVSERDKALEERRVKDEAEMERRQAEMQQKTREPKTAKPEKDHGKSVNIDDRQARHEEKLRRLQAEDAANAQKRAENIAAYERKVRESEERQREVAAKKLEKEKEKEKK